MCGYDTQTTVRQWLYSAPKFICALSSILMIMLFVNLHTRSELFDQEVTVVLKSVFENVGRDPISEITVTIDPQCPTDFEMVPLTRWGGTRQGCSCTDGITFSHSCPKGCTRVDAVDSRQIYIWDSLAFCVKRAEGLFNKTRGECPENTIECSGNKCIDSSQMCPLVDIQIVPIDGTNYTDYEEIPIGEETRIIYSRNAIESDEFFIDLNVSLYDKPCMNPNKVPTTDKGASYSLLRVPEDGCGQFGTVKHLRVLEETSVETVLVQNHVTVSNIEKLPGFSDYISGEEAVLTALQRYTLSDHPICQRASQALSPGIFGNLNRDEEAFISTVKGVSLVLFLLTLALMVTVPLEFLLRYRNKEEQRIMLRAIAYLNIIGLGMLFTLFLYKGIIAVSAQGDFNPKVYQLRDLRNFNCFKQQEVQDLLILLLQQVTDDIYVILALNITLLFLGFAGIIVLVVLTVIDLNQVQRLKESQSMAASTRRKKNKKNDRNRGNEMLLMNQH